MKKQFLALIGGVMVAGLAMAAEVVGNNTAVVIQKTKVESSTGFQFLCVPVAPLDITGGNAGTLTLAGVFPPELYDTNAKVTRTVLSEETGQNEAVNYKISVDDDGKNKWVTDTTPAKDANTHVVIPGEIFWLNTQATGDPGGFEGGEADTASTLDTASETTSALVFCGQAIAADVIKPTEPGIAAYGNTNSEAKTLADLIESPTNGSIVYAIQEGASDYKTFIYSSGRGYWRMKDPSGGSSLVSAKDVKIAAGEAFYYQKR